ncbi:MAG: tRNA 2-thiouridine(34) synthase MnmA [Alphaproteobacteria bacterium]|nr:tRNA 2-thiouridine(34) synthase MnmA [Alphaproteobacteria bacterium]
MIPCANSDYLFDFTSQKLPSETKVVVAMSGGVDSSFVAAKLKKLGYDVTGITLQLYDQGNVKTKSTCCAGQDIYDAKTVADQFNFPHYVLDYESKFRKEVIEDFADTYLRGETPLPCAKCNQTVKFRDLLKFAQDLGADTLVTGHYVRSVKGNFGAELHKASDKLKDQSYFLFNTTREQLEFTQFPLGYMSKESTRIEAQKLGLQIADKPDSQDICFVPSGSYVDVITKIRPGANRPGKFIHVDGYELGNHSGIINFTIGQRRGLGIASKEPLYVVKIDPESGLVYVGGEKHLFTETFMAKDCNWIGDQEIPEEGLDVEIKTRSRHLGVSAKIKRLDKTSINVRIPGGDKSVSPGQACVFYQGTRVLGGGWISK